MDKPKEKALTDRLADKILDDPYRNGNVDEKEDKFLELLAECQTVREAGLRAGYSESYCSGTIYHKLKSKRFQNRLIHRYKGENAVHLAKVSRINQNVLNQLVKETEEGDLRNVGKTQHVARQALQISGLLAQDGGKGQQTVNVSGVQNLMIQLHNQSPDDTKPEKLIDVP
ncbi:MAG: hypothetical protein SWO11_18865 [Thermodesulfobacteriota bacterium]|nr:hypothetical protein [Thermodesulfobacteriota bacterium]